MKKAGILHHQLEEAICRARHGDTIIILDAGMPVPAGCNYIDLGIVKGVPSFLTVVKAILNEMVIERYDVFELMPQYNPQMHETLQKMLPHQQSGLLSKEDMMALMPAAKAVVRTGEFGSCCNMVLYSASGRDAYVEKFDVSFKMES